VSSVYRRCVASALFAGLAFAVPLATGGYAQSTRPEPVKIALTTDMSGPNSQPNGIHSVEAARMAIEDFGGTVLGRPVELIYADNQNKPDVALSIAREWIDVGHVNAILEGSISSIALAVQDLTRQHNIPHLLTGAGSVDLTGKACSPMTIQFEWDTYSLTKSLVEAMVRQGKDTWFIIAADYATGQTLERDISRYVVEAGGKVVGSVRHPVNSAGDFSAYLLQAQASGAKVIAPATVGSDLVNLVKQADEFQITQRGQAIVMVSSNVTDIQSIGLGIAGGLNLSQPFYHDMNEETRAWSDRLRKRDNDNLPNMHQAGVYSAVTHFLKAVKAAGMVEGRAVMAKMREMPINDFEMKNVMIRADGTAMRPMYLFRVKHANESRYKYDLLDLVSVVPPEVAWKKLEETGCELVSKK
jgi:branched-chain amino acid transport system substrate-binding protein